MKTKPGLSLPYLEFHITDHCNLGCMGCTHFSPLAAENYLSPAAFQKDMSRLAELFVDIPRMRLMGGEPLLHPAVNEFLPIARSYFPNSHFTLVTNGLLLPSMPESFYEALKQQSVGLDITLYPLTAPRMPEAVRLAEQHGILIEYQDSKEFCRFLNPSGDSDPVSTFRECWVNYCTFLRSGRLYPCSLPALAHIVNARFGWAIPEDGGISIHAGSTAQEILDFLSWPIPTCAYCTKPYWFPWSLSAKNPEEWIAPRP